jgi:hypothetical protein
VDDLAENLEAAETLGLRTVLYESNRQLCADLNRLGFLKSANNIFESDALKTTRASS